ncbi:unnamed protein product [Rodentolepis nana]|uniref:C2H2-type domain-containing protein n=1 Tax=Rodentolepis nana TaxID=102285 RepID=A0A0R3T8J2_RODNA|nr:unnamed protein product [Rodentolepis nana]
MDLTCPFCNVDLPHDLFHDHFAKCMKVTNAMQQQEPYQPPLPDEHNWSYQPSEYSKSSQSNPPSVGQSWQCSCCNLNFVNRKEFQEHLTSAKHKMALNSNISGGSSGYPNSGQPASELTDIAAAPQHAPNFRPPPTMAQVNKGAPQPHQFSEEEMRSIVRSEMAKYMRQLLQIIENDTSGYPI